MTSMDARSVERSAYRSRWDDGLFDVFVGGSLVWIGIAWLWVEPIAGFAALLPAVLAGPFVAFRSRFIEERTGYVRFSKDRRRWERRNLVVFISAGAIALCAAVIAYVIVTEGTTAADFAETIVPGLISFILASMVGLVAFVSMVPRLFAYAAILLIGGALAAAFASNPGAPVLVAGVVVSLVGAWLVHRFVSRHPRSSQRDGFPGV